MNSRILEVSPSRQDAIELRRVTQCLDCGKGITRSSTTGRCAACAGRRGNAVYWAAKRKEKRVPEKPQRVAKPQVHCIDCGAVISPTSIRCVVCNGKKRAEEKRKRELTASPWRGEGRFGVVQPSECPEGGAHWWLIGRPNGAAVLPATCKKCNVDRTYAAALEPSKNGLVPVVIAGRAVG